MRRWLILFLLSLLPLEVAWATAATTDYCDRGQGQIVQHFGHHDDAHPPGTETPVNGDHPDKYPDKHPKLDHGHSHLSGFLGLLSEISVSTPQSPQLFLHCDEPACLSVPPDNLERPNWSDLA